MDFWYLFLMNELDGIKPITKSFFFFLVLTKTNNIRLKKKEIP